MWLEELQLTDFRGFRHLKLDLRRQLTVMIGVNGAGKSSLVEALEIGASHSLQAAFPHRTSLSFADTDVHVGQASCILELRFESLTLRVERTSDGKTKRTSKDLPEGTLPPLFIFFKSDRAVLKREPPPKPGMSFWARATVVSRNPAWDDDIRDQFTLFEQVEQWLHQREDLENQERVRSKQLDYTDPGLEVARHAIATVLPGYQDLHIDRNLSLNGSQIVLTKNGLNLTADMLSEGERTQLVLTMAIARRLSKRNSSTPGNEHACIVVIDEIELHLHPKWQRNILPSLLRAFPHCQFIVTTHSPQVIGSVPRENVVVLDDFAVYHAAAPTEGRDSNAILEEIMDVPTRDEAAQAELDEIARLIDRDEQDRARSAIDRLAGRWGEDDREVVRLRTALQVRGLYDADDSQEP